MKASEILQKIGPETQDKIQEFKEGLRQNELVQAFELCANCGGQISFSHRSDWLSYTVTEQGCCKTCQGQIPARVFRLH